jgi:hypothetical protein
MTSNKRVRIFASPNGFEKALCLKNFKMNTKKRSVILLMPIYLKKLFNSSLIDLKTIQLSAT